MPLHLPNTTPGLPLLSYMTAYRGWEEPFGCWAFLPPLFPCLPVLPAYFCLAVAGLHTLLPSGWNGRDEQRGIARAWHYACRSIASCSRCTCGLFSNGSRLLPVHALWVHGRDGVARRQWLARTGLASWLRQDGAGKA